MWAGSSIGNNTNNNVCYIGLLPVKVGQDAESICDRTSIAIFIMCPHLHILKIEFINTHFSSVSVVSKGWGHSNLESDIIMVAYYREDLQQRIW